WHGLRLMPTEKLIALPQTFDIQESWISALNQSPEFNRLKEELARQGLVVKYDFNQLFPYLNAFGSYSRRGFDETVYRQDRTRVITPGFPPITNDITRLVRVQDSDYDRVLNDIGIERNPTFT